MRLLLRSLRTATRRTLPSNPGRAGLESHRGLSPFRRHNHALHPTVFLSMRGFSSEIERPSKRMRMMASDSAELVATSKPGGPPPQVRLDPEEALLRTLLLDTVEYIQLKHGKRPTGSGLVLRFTGGWVRDKILGVGSQDIDVGISSMTGYDFGLALKEYLDIPEKLEKYKSGYPEHALKGVIGGLHKIAANPEKSKHLETTTIRVFGFDVDLVNLRKETYTDNSRNPQVEFGTAEEDALRRDATVNALFYNLHTEEVEDFTGGGLADMESKLIRTPLAPHQTFMDDPLRVLRLIRFASRLAYTIDPATEEAMQSDEIKRSLTSKISEERIGIEIEKMLRGPNPLASLKIIDRLGLYDTIFSNRTDDVAVDTSSWPVVYNVLNTILNDEAGSEVSRRLRQSIHGFLIRNPDEEYRAWMIAALTPWALVDAKNPLSADEIRKQAPRPARVVRDSLRCDKKLTALLSVANSRYQLVSDTKSSLTTEGPASPLPDTRWKLAKLIRVLGADWRLCFIQAILLDIIRGQDAENVLNGYLKVLQFLKEQNLLDVNDLRPLVNGRDMLAALNLKPGSWLTPALDIAMEWQIRNPDRSDAEGALEEVIRRKHEFKK